MDGTTQTSASDINADPHCQAQVASRIFEALGKVGSGLNVPKVRIESLVGSTNVNNNRIYVAGLRAPYASNWTTSDNNSSMSFNADSPSGAEPSGRLVLSMLEKNGSTGTFYSRNEYGRGFRCMGSGATSSNNEVNLPGCDGSQVIVCRMKEETRIDLRLKDGSTTNFRGVVSSITSAFGGDIKGGNAYTGTTTPSAFCQETLTESRQELIDFIKQ
jgi:hypothetical protein